MIRRVLIVVGCFCLLTTTKGQPNKKQLLQRHFTSHEVGVCNTAKTVEYLSKEEKKVILYVNMARVYPVKFAQFYKEYLKYFNKNGAKKFKSKNRYYYTLYKDLIKLRKQKLTPLRADETLYQYAKCWAKESGKKGVIGHNRKRCKKGRFAECCSYGNLKPLAFVLNLLVDEGIPSLGHRKILFTNYKKVGVSINTHKTYSRCVVIDLI